MLANWICSTYSLDCERPVRRQIITLQTPNFSQLSSNLNIIGASLKLAPPPFRTSCLLSHSYHGSGPSNWLCDLESILLSFASAQVNSVDGDWNVCFKCLLREKSGDIYRLDVQPPWISIRVCLC